MTSSYLGIARMRRLLLEPHRVELEDVPHDHGIGWHGPCTLQPVRAAEPELVA
jgi:hypothetical protein